MTIDIVIRHKPAPTDDIIVRHRSLLQKLGAFPYFLESDPSQSDATNLGLEFSGSLVEGATIDLTPWCVRGINAALRYGPRGGDLADMAMYDDKLIVVIDDDMDIYRRFINESIVPLIRIVDAYRSDVHIDQSLMIDDHCKAVEDNVYKQADTDDRRFVRRINSVNFFGRNLCRSAFDATPEAIVQAIRGEVERAEILNDGAFFVVTSNKLSRLELEQIDPKIRSRIARASSNLKIADNLTRN